MLGSDIVRCGSCGTRFLYFGRFSIPSPAHDGSAGNDFEGGNFASAWFAILAGFLACLGIGLWTLHKFHRWPF